MTLGLRIKKLRQRKKMNQKELAQASGISQATISRLEADLVMQLKSDALSRLASALGTTVDYLIGREDTMSESDNQTSNSEAQDLLNSFKELSPDGRQELLNYLDYLESKMTQQPEKKKSKRRKK